MKNSFSKYYIIKYIDRIMKKFKIIYWLISKNVFIKYIKNSLSLNSESCFNILYNCLIKNREDKTLEEAFIWEDSPEGFKYWNDKNNRFLVWYWYR